MMMKQVLLAAINAKYIHSNLAIYDLCAYAKEKAPQYADQIWLGEYTINQQKDEILQEIYRKKPDLLAFSCYIWNLEYVYDICENLHKVLPDTKIWLGGPEVSFDCEQLLKEHPYITGIMTGEGEKSFLALVLYYLGGEGELSKVPGVWYREEDQILAGEVMGPAHYMNMDEIPFVYQDLEAFSNKIIYYESSRGCPFSCSYCLSSIDKRVRFRSMELVKKELQFFLDHQVPQVKFVDRTFNCNHPHAMEIWQYIIDHDNGITNFHFEIEADLISEEELKLLAKMRPGLIQMEIGVQSTNSRTLEAVHRRTDFEKIAQVVRKVSEGHNIHQHLDLIAGLPYEDYESFARSFNMVYALHPQELQLGFLKVLKGSRMHQEAQDYEICYRRKPVYEVLSTRWLSFDEILRLKGVEDMLEVYYNSQQFARTIEALEGYFPSAFALYEALADFMEEKGSSGMSYSRMQRLEFLREFAHRTDPKRTKWLDEKLLMDLYLRENAKTRPAWAEQTEEDKSCKISFYRAEEEKREYLSGYEGYNWKQMSKMTHLEHFSCDPDQKPGTDEDTKDCWILFDYSRRDPLTKDARTIRMDSLQ